MTEFAFVTDNVTDISPVRALVGLKKLRCYGSITGQGQAVRLVAAERNAADDPCLAAYTQVRDLSPLRGMKLTYLTIEGTQVSDLSPLEGMSLTSLHCDDTPVSDLSPLKGMPLTRLECNRTRIVDLSPLKGMPLAYLRVCGTQRIQPVPAERIASEGRCLSTARSYLTYHRWKEWNWRAWSFAAPKYPNSRACTECPGLLDCGDTKVSDLSPLKGMPLTWLWCDGTQVSDLSPLEGMRLEGLCCTAPKSLNCHACAGCP